MTLRRVSLWSAFGLFALIVFALAWLWFADLGVLKPQIERWVTERTGRGFSIGDLEIDLAGRSVVIAEDVRLQNADWADEPDMAAVGRIEVRIDLWSLFSGPAVIELIDVDDAEIHLALTEGRDPNWRFPSAAGGRQAESEDREGRVGLLVGHVDVERVKLRYESVQRDGPLELNVESLRQQHRDDGFLDFGLDATLNGRTISLDGEAGTWDALLSGRDIRFDLSAGLDTLQVSANGYLDDVANLQRPGVEFTATAPDIDDLTRMLGLGDEGDGDIDLSGTLRPVEDGPVRISLAGNVGRTEIDGIVELTHLRQFDDVDVDLRASGPDLGRILRIAGIHGVREAPFEIHVDGERHGPLLEVRKLDGRFAGAQFHMTATLPGFPRADAGSVEAHVTGPSIERLLYVTGAPPVASGPFDVALTVDSGDAGRPDLTLDLRTPLGEARMTGTVGGLPTFAGSELDVSADVGSVAKVAAAYGVMAQVPDWPAKFSGQLRVDADGIHTKKPAALSLGDVEATVDGVVALKAGLRGTRVKVGASGGSLAGVVGGFTDPAWVPTQAFDANATLLLDGNELQMREVSGSLGGASFTGEGVLTFAGGIAGSRFSAKVDGPALEEFTGPLGGLRVREGPFTLSGSIAFSDEAIGLDDIELERADGSARLDMDIGRSGEEPWLELDARARGRDVHTLFRGAGGFELLELPFSVRAEGNMRGGAWSIRAAKVEIGDASSTAGGVVDLANGASADFELAASVPSLARFARFDGRALRDQALALAAEITGADGTISAKNLKLTVGESDLAGDISVRTGDVPVIEAVIRSDSVVVAPLLEQPDVPPEPIAGSGDGRLIPEIAMPFDLLAGFDASLNIDIGTFRYERLHLRAIDVEASVRDGVLDVSEARFDAPAGAAAARFRLDPAGGSGTGNLRFVARDFNLGLSDANPATAQSSDWDVSIDVTGTDLRSMLAAADGVVFVRHRGGRISKGNPFLQALYGDVLEEILDTINPFRTTDPYTQFECIVVANRITDGKAASAPSSLVSTDKLLIVVRTSLDLATEKIEVGIRTAPKRRFSVSVAELINPYIQVVGTLAAPRLAVDQQGVLITGGAAVATGGLTILAQGLWDRLSRSSDPCAQAVDAGMDELGDGLPGLAVDGTGAQ